MTVVSGPRRRGSVKSGALVACVVALLGYPMLPAAAADTQAANNQAGDKQGASDAQGVGAGDTQESRDRQAAEQLANAILIHVRERLPADQIATADAEDRRVRSFTRAVTSMVAFPTPPGQLEAAALAAIDSASKQPATASELVRAALGGVLDSIGHDAKLVSGFGQGPPVVRRQTSFRDVGNIRIVAPAFVLESMADLSCSGFNQYFDFSHSTPVGVVLDLRGNEGGVMDIAVCLADQFIGPGIPIYTIRTKDGRDSRDTRAVLSHPPLTLPVAIFIDKDTNSGALGFAAGLQDRHRATIIGEQTQKINGNILNMMMPRRAGADMYMLPVGEMLHPDGRPLGTTGVRVDVAANPSDDDAMIAAARKEFERLKR